MELKVENGILLSESIFGEQPSVFANDASRTLTATEVESALSSERVAKSVYTAIRESACTLRADVFDAIRNAWLSSKQEDENSRQSSVLHSMVENATIGGNDNVPICQDTGTVWVCLEVGEELAIPGNIFSQVNEAVSRAYIDGRLRMSVVKDALFDRSNTQNNTPAFCELRLVPGRGAKLHVLLKGGGSDNASRLLMLNPSDGKDGVKSAVLNCVREKAANACPPLIIGIGIGSTFDKVAGMAKHALLRHIGSKAQNEEAARFEKELLDAVNATGIGPGALGGFPTALAVHIETAPCHIAALPLAINMGCSAMRSTTINLVTPDGVPLQEPSVETWENDMDILHETEEQSVQATIEGIAIEGEQDDRS